MQYVKKVKQWWSMTLPKRTNNSLLIENNTTNSRRGILLIILTHSCQRKWWRYMNICRVERKHWTLVRTCTLQFRGKSNKKLSQENMCVSVLIQDLNFQCYMSWICCVVLNEKRVVCSFWESHWPSLFYFLNILHLLSVIKSQVNMFCLTLE
jgi:hypothetical protein